MNRADELHGHTLAQQFMNPINKRSFDIMEVQHVLLHQNNSPFYFLALSLLVIVNILLLGLATKHFYYFLHHLWTGTRSHQRRPVSLKKTLFFDIENEKWERQNLWGDFFFDKLGEINYKSTCTALVWLAGI